MPIFPPHKKYFDLLYVCVCVIWQCMQFCTDSIPDEKNNNTFHGRFCNGTHIISSLFFFVFSGSHQLFFGETKLTKASK